MADSSLDDFFAKKDKSKKKPKPKAAGDGNATQSSKSVKEKKKKDKDKANTVTSSGNKTTINNGQEEDDDWNDFEEVKAVDYSGLRIQNLQIAKDEPERENEGEEPEYDEDGEVKEKRDASGPWRNKGSVPTPAPVPVEAKPKEEPAATPKAPARYIPPAQRMAANTSSTVSGPRRKKEAPNVNSEVDFPTLGGGPQDSNASPYVVETPNQRRAANVPLENKFSALQEHH